MCENIEQIKQIIYKNYPKNLQWGSDEYFASPEFINYTKQSRTLKDSKLKANLLYLTKEIVQNYAVKDWTNFELYNDIEFKILLHKGIDYMDDDIELLKAVNYKQDELILFISLIDKYFYILQLHTIFKYGRYYFYNINKNTDSVLVIQRLKDVFEKKGYKFINKEIAKIILPDVSTELKNFGEANIFDCLFNDITTL